MDIHGRCGYCQSNYSVWGYSDIHVGGGGGGGGYSSGYPWMVQDCQSNSGVRGHSDIGGGGGGGV